MSKEMLVAINVLKREWTLAKRESHVGSKVDSFNKLEGINYFVYHGSPHCQ